MVSLPSYLIYHVYLPSSLRHFLYPFSHSFDLTVTLFSFRVPAIRIPCAKIMQLVSLVLRQGDIDAYALLVSRVNIAKKVRFRIIWQKFQYDFYVNIHDCHYGG